MPKRNPPRRSEVLEIGDPVINSITIDGGLDSHELETLQLELRALANSCGLEVTDLEVASLDVKAAKRG